MKELVTTYTFEDGKIITKKMKQSEYKRTVGYYLEPEECLFSKTEMNRHHLENEMYHLKQRIEKIYKMDEILKEYGYEPQPISLNYNPTGLSIKTIDETIALLNDFKNRYRTE